MSGGIVDCAESDRSTKICTHRTESHETRGGCHSSIGNAPRRSAGIRSGRALARSTYTQSVSARQSNPMFASEIRAVAAGRQPSRRAQQLGQVIIKTRLLV